MAVRRENIPSELKDVQFGCSWLPTTPTKPNSTKKQPICKNLQENHSAQANSFETEGNTSVNQAAKANWSEPGRLIEDFLQESLSQRLSSCYGSKNSNGLGSNYFNTLRTGEEATSSSIYEENLRSFDTSLARGNANSDVHCGDLNMYKKFLTDDPDKWANVSFGSLLALAHGVGSTRAENVFAQTGLFARGSTSSYHFRPQNDGGQYKMICGSSWLGRKAHVGLNNVPEILTDGSSIPSTPFFDFNAPTGMTTAASSKSTSFQVQPITPDKTNGTEKRASAKQESSIDTQENNTANQLCATTSTQLQENHKPDNGTTEDPDANKTPQQKNRRKKHRPKVITEEQRKSTLKQSADKPSGPQETTRPKRTYTRRKRVHNSANSPLQVETNGTDLDNNVVNSKDIPMGKSKPVRRKRADKHEDIMDKGTPETADIKTTRRTNSSCKRSLNFNLENQVRDESSSYCQSSNRDMESQEKVDATDQSTTLHVDLLQDDHVFTNQSTRGKCQIVFSNVTHDKEANTVQVLANTNGQQTPKSLNGSICSNTCSTPEINARGLKRQHIGTTIEAELCYKNANGTFYNSMQAYSSIFEENVDSNNSPPGMHLPAIYKKKRTGKVQNTSISSLHYAVTASDNQVKLEREPLGNSCAELFKSRVNQGSSVAQCKYSNLLSSTAAADGFHIQNEPELFVSMLPSVPAERIKKKRTKSATRVCNPDSPLEICKELPASLNRAATSYRIKHGTEIPHEPHTCMQPLVADTCSTMTTTKQSRRNMHVNLTVQNMYNDQEFASKSMGPQLAVTWECVSPVESVVEQLKRLDLSAETSQASLQEHNAFMAYHMKYQDFSTLVPYQRVGTVVPFDSSFYRVRRRKPRPKVDLDDETTRVWKLLLENINSEGIDGTDEEKAQWWEEERRIFTGRADSFIARMHLVQGDRRFSPWKGSVIDSVIGVFLTQNVSDHLSSSAFMSLAARFPLQSKPNLAELKKKKLDTTPEASVLDPDESFELRKEVLKKTVCGEGAKITQDHEDNETIGNSVRPSANIVKPSGLNYDISVPKDGLGVQFPDIYKQYSVMSHESTVENSTNLIEGAGDIDEALSSQTSVISSQNSVGSQVALNIERTESCSLSTSEEPNSMADTKRCTSSTSFMKLLQMAGTILQGVHENSQEKERTSQTESLRPQNEGDYEDSIYLTKPVKSCNKSLCLAPISEQQPAQCFDLSEENSNFSYSSSIKGFCTTEISTLSAESESHTTFQKSATATFEEAQKSNTRFHSSNYGQNKINQKVEDNQTGKVPSQILLQEINYRMQEVSNVPGRPQNLMSNTGTSGNIDNLRNSEHKEVKANNNDPGYPSSKMVNEPKARGIVAKEKQHAVDWDNLRQQAQAGDRKTERTANTMDSVDWDAVRCADVNEIADTIKERGMNNKLAERIKDFLDRVVRDHGSIDLEWLRDVPPDKAKEYLLSFRGLGLKSVECVRLLTLHHLAFPVDTNVGRIAVRLGWVPLQTLPESLQLHLLELYPILESIQKYLWPRLCKLDQKTLYELHYQMITFGKVFCTKSKPNCNACPMRGECRHFASAFASARLALPAPQDKSIALATENFATDQIPLRSMNTLHLSSPEANQRDAAPGISNSQPIIEEPATPEPIIEQPPSPETAYEDPNEIPTIQLNMDEFTHNLQKIMQQNTELQEGDMSKALVALTSEAASIPVPKLKNVSQLRTEHQVYELPDSHPLLEEMDKREPDDPCPYLLAIWTPGETVDSIESPRRMCSSQESEKLCTRETCLSCNCLREANSQTIRGTLLIPCRTAMRGSFPLNGTYFQVNEVFADHKSSLAPMDVPREWLWNLPRRTVYFGTSIPTIFKGLSTEGIQYCFWRGFVCVRGFDRRTRAPRPLIARLHFPASKREKKNR